MPNTSGLLCRSGIIADKDAVTVAKMRQAGAIPIALTNCSELCMWYESNNLVYGRSKNAYHQGRMVGGSSGEFRVNKRHSHSVVINFTVTLGERFLFVMSCCLNSITFSTLTNQLTNSPIAQW